MSNQQDQPAKSNGLGTDPMQRLASFKTPRDLTLGGIKPNKKVFTPNLNVSRNKNKSGPSTNASQKKDDNRNHRERRNDRNRGSRNGPNIIKSSGVFSEGLGSVERHSSRSYSGYRDSDPSPVLQRPTIRVKDVVKIDKELEDQKIRAVMGEDPETDGTEDFKRTSHRDDPVRLPMDDGGWSVAKPKPAVVKHEVLVKMEPTDDVEHFITSTLEIKAEKKENVFENTDVLDLLKSDQPTLILLQLPDSLPGQGGRLDDDGPRRKNDPTTSTTDDADVDAKKDTRCRLEDLEEGKIGRLRIHQSGRVTMALGDTIFEVCAGTKASFYQEVVSVACDDSSKSANIVSLGPLQHKLNIVPDWEKLFKDIKM